VEEVDTGEHAIQSLLGRGRGPPLDERPRIFVQGCDMDVQVEPARANELQTPTEGGVDFARLDPCDEGLRDPCASRERPLRKAGATSRFPDELPSLHALDDTCAAYR